MMLAGPAIVAGRQRASRPVRPQGGQRGLQIMPCRRSILGLADGPQLPFTITSSTKHYLPCEPLCRLRWTPPGGRREDDGLRPLVGHYRLTLGRYGVTSACPVLGKALCLLSKLAVLRAVLSEPWLEALQVAVSHELPPCGKGRLRCGNPGVDRRRCGGWRDHRGHWCLTIRVRASAVRGAGQGRKHDQNQYRHHQRSGESDGQGQAPPPRSFL